MSEHELRIRARVQSGVDYLRNAYGGVSGLDWLSNVNTFTLDMGSNHSCVLGQVTGDFATSPLTTALGFKYASECGFYLTLADMEEGLTYEELTQEWVYRITWLQRERSDKLLHFANAGLDDSWREFDIEGW